MTGKEREQKPYKILDTLLMGRPVSRWDVSIWKRELRAIIKSEEKYSSLYEEVESIIESANESR